MAALVLSVAGQAAGGALFGPIGAIAGRVVGALGGGLIDQSLFAGRRDASLQGPRLSDLEVMASTAGAPGRAQLRESCAHPVAQVIASK
jgi:hypothetical protein